MVDTVLKTLKVSERRACRVIGQVRTTQRYIPEVRSEEERLTVETVNLATRYGRYGYHRITALLRQEGWKVNHKRVERIWRKEGLKVTCFIVDMWKSFPQAIHEVYPGAKIQYDYFHIWQTINRHLDNAMKE